MSARPYIAHRAPVLTDTPVSESRPWVAPQGRPAWTARRCSPELARDLREAKFHNADCGFHFEAASSCTVIGAESDPPKPPLSPAEAYLLMVIYVLSCCIAAWVLCQVADALKAAL